MPHYKLENVKDFAGFSAENALAGATSVKIITKDLITSDDPNFYKRIDFIFPTFFNTTKYKVPADGVNRFVIILHKDSTADVYFDDFAVSVEIKAKRNIAAGQAVNSSDIADIRRVKFDGINIDKTDKIICCLKIGWKFALFFDFGRRHTELDIEDVQRRLGDVYRYLSFQYIYVTLEPSSEVLYKKILKDGWFPFLEIASEYKTLSEAYKNDFDIEGKTEAIVKSFDGARIKLITEKWWKVPVFGQKRKIIEAGIEAYLRGSETDYINCIKNLSSELEGILRSAIYRDTKKGDNVKVRDMLKYVKTQGVKIFGSGFALSLPEPFVDYLKNAIFLDFSVEKGEVELSRHSVNHGVVDSEKYTKYRALQLILVLDQIYYFMNQ